MTLVDTHSHIYLPEFQADMPAILQRAESQGINKILLPGIDSSTHEAMLALERVYPNQCISMIGLHPCSVKANEFKIELNCVYEYLRSRSFIAVGEIGLDFYWDKTFLALQYEAFEQQIKWALEFDLPIVIHSRDSIDECINLVEKNQNGRLTGVFHCFSGSIEQANRIIEMGFFLGIGGVVTFKNAGLDKVMLQLSLDKIVLETDAPYLAPVPYRGKRNEPSYLCYVIEKLSTLKNIPVQEVATITTLNAKNLFRL